MPVNNSLTLTMSNKKGSMSYPFPQDVSLVINVARFLLKVELNPVVKSNHFRFVASLSNKNVLKATGIMCPRASSPLVWIHKRL